jgi:hypothetical protein
MHWLRRMHGFVRVLAALFVLAQLAGVVSSASAKAVFAPGDLVVQIQHQYAHEHGDGGQHFGDRGKAHHHDHSGTADDCCALHAFFAGILPPTIAITTAKISGARLAADVADRDVGLPPSSLDRPPRPLH